MSTLATACRTIPSQQLSLLHQSTTLSALSPVSRSTSPTPPPPTTTPFLSVCNTMHPDKLLLQGHGVTSPRLCSGGSSAEAHHQGGAKKTATTTVGRSAAGTETTPMQIDDGGTEVRGFCMDHRQCRRSRVDNTSSSTFDDDLGSATTTGEGHASLAGDDDDDDDVIEDNNNDDDDNNNKHIMIDEDEDVAADIDNGDESLCSDDSELSVGQEGAADVSIQVLPPTNRLILSKMSDMMAMCRPSVVAPSPALSSSRRDSGRESSDNVSSVSADESHQLPEDSGDNVNPAAFVMANALRLPSVVRPSPTRFQEEFLRKSHIYAEELMKQQMQFMAAARANALSLRHTAAGISPSSAASTSPSDAAIGKVGFRPHARSSNISEANSLPNYSGIHSHLSAISKMSQLRAAAAAAASASNASFVSAGSSGESDALAKLTAFELCQQQRDMTGGGGGSVSNLNQLQQQMQAHLPFMNNTNNNNNNNLHEPSLKFSIDNILKADFGRRITDPLMKRGGHGGGFRAAAKTLSHRKSANSNANKLLHHQTSPKQTGAPIDLTSIMTAAAAVTAAPSSAYASATATTVNVVCTNSNDSTSSTVASSNNGTVTSTKSPSMTAASACSLSPPPVVGKTDNNASTDGAHAGGSSSSSSSSSTSGGVGGGKTPATGSSSNGPIVWPAWVYCTRYSDRPSSGRSPRTRKPKKPASENGTSPPVAEDKRPRTAFSGSQLARLKHEFTENRYLTEKRRQQLSSELGLNEAQIKIWFQNKRAKLKKTSGTKNPLALQLMAQGLYNHSTVPLTREEEELQEMQANAAAAAAAAAAGAV